MKCWNLKKDIFEMNFKIKKNSLWRSASDMRRCWMHHVGPRSRTSFNLHIRQCGWRYSIASWVSSTIISTWKWWCGRRIVRFCVCNSRSFDGTVLGDSSICIVWCRMWETIICGDGDTCSSRTTVQSLVRCDACSRKICRSWGWCGEG